MPATESMMKELIVSDLPPFPEFAGVRFIHIPGFTGYAAGDDGTVWSCLVPSKKSRLVGVWHRKSSWPNEDGYLFVALRGDDGKEHRPFVHSVILLAFVGPAPPSHEACHFPDRNPSNNSLSNLRWGTRRENMEDARKHGTLPSGEKNGHAKLSNLKSRAVRDLRLAGWTQRDIASLFDVSQPTISAVDRRERWADDSSADPSA